MIIKLRISYFVFYLFFHQILFSQNVVIGNDALNVLFSNFENKVRLAVENVPSSELDGKIDVGGIEKIKNGFFKIITPNQGKVNISLFRKGEKVGEKVFRIKKMPMPENRIWLWRISCVDCTNHADTYEIFADSNYAKCQVTEFELIILFPDKTQKVFQVKGSKMTEEIITLMKNRKAGTIYYFEKIKAHCEKCSDVFSLPSTAISIKK